MIIRRIITIILLFCFNLTCIGHLPAHAQSINDLPVPGTMVNLSPAFEPVLIKGLKIHPDNPFAFDFILDTGDDRAIRESPLREESQKLIKYFLAAMTIREKDLWVNLSPYEKNRMIADNLGQTEMGRDMLAQDYILKQLTASLIYPEKELGKKFWDNVYQKTQQIYGSNVQIPVNTFNKVWIVADKADVFERGNVAYIVGAHLKVMMEEDYLALQKQLPLTPSLKIKRGENVAKSPLFDKEGIKGSSNNINTIASQIIREVIIPEIEKEVNTGKNFAPLRQMFYSMILASWYKMALKDSLLTQVYGNQSKVKVGINTNDPTEKEKIFQRYLQAYKKGVFNYIKEEISSLPLGGRPTGSVAARATRAREGGNTTIPRKYFSGGVDGAMLASTITRLQKVTRPLVASGLIFLASVNVFASNNAPLLNPSKVSATQIDPAMTHRVFAPTDKITFRGGVNKDELKSFTATMKEVMGSLEKSKEYTRKRQGYAEPKGSLSKKLARQIITAFPSADEQDIHFLNDEEAIRDATEEFLWVIKRVDERKKFFHEAWKVFAVFGDVFENEEEMTLEDLKRVVTEKGALSSFSSEQDKGQLLTAVLWTLPKASNLNVYFTSSTGSKLEIGKKVTGDSPLQDLELSTIIRNGLLIRYNIETVGQIDFKNLTKYLGRGIDKGGLRELEEKGKKYGFLDATNPVPDSRKVATDASRAQMTNEPDFRRAWFRGLFPDKEKDILGTVEDEMRETVAPGFIEALFRKGLGVASKENAIALLEGFLGNDLPAILAKGSEFPVTKKQLDMMQAIGECPANPLRREEVVELLSMIRQQPDAASVVSQGADSILSRGKKTEPLMVSIREQGRAGFGEKLRDHPAFVANQIVKFLNKKSKDVQNIKVVSTNRSVYSIRLNSQPDNQQYKITHGVRVEFVDGSWVRVACNGVALIVHDSTADLHMAKAVLLQILTAYGLQLRKAHNVVEAKQIDPVTQAKELVANAAMNSYTKSQKAKDLYTVYEWLAERDHLPQEYNLVWVLGSKFLAPIKQGVKLYKSKPSKTKIIITGGVGRNTTSLSLLKKNKLIDEKIEKSLIKILDDLGRISKDAGPEAMWAYIEGRFRIKRGRDNDIVAQRYQKILKPGHLEWGDFHKQFLSAENIADPELQDVQAGKITIEEHFIDRLVNPQTRYDSLIPEGLVYYAKAIAEDVDPEDLYVDAQSTTTLENVIYGTDILKEHEMVPSNIVAVMADEMQRRAKSTLLKQLPEFLPEWDSSNNGIYSYAPREYRLADFQAMSDEQLEAMKVRLIPEVNKLPGLFTNGSIVEVKMPDDVKRSSEALVKNLVEVAALSENILGGRKDANAAMNAPTVKQSTVTHGGIDFDRSKMNMNVRKDVGLGGVDMAFDPAMIERIRREGFDGLEFKIESIIPVTNLPLLLGV